MHDGGEGTHPNYLERTTMPVMANLRDKDAATLDEFQIYMH